MSTDFVIGTKQQKSGTDLLTNKKCCSANTFLRIQMIQYKLTDYTVMKTQSRMF